MKTYEIIYQPVVTEKSTLMQENKIFAFWVNKKASKIDIKNAIKSIYGADVDSVKVVNTRSKERRIRKGVMQKRDAGKKAYITLVGKANLDTTKFEKTKADQDKKSSAKKTATKATKATKKSTK
ncbi:50S ribosomal protein L23 [Candidatus Peregrinibacteria bacterium]|nr:50S ribosomal protein L23 [Candidatus Peregrinibacteria bacterium]